MKYPLGKQSFKDFFLLPCGKMKQNEKETKTKALQSLLECVQDRVRKQ
jgi:hypothetical protein